MIDSFSSGKVNAMPSIPKVIYSNESFSFDFSVCIVCGLIMTRSFSLTGTSCVGKTNARSEEHTSELQSRFDLVCRLLLEKKNTQHQSCNTRCASPRPYRIQPCARQ